MNIIPVSKVRRQHSSAQGLIKKAIENEITQNTAYMLNLNLIDIWRGEKNAEIGNTTSSTLGLIPPPIVHKYQRIVKIHGKKHSIVLYIWNILLMRIVFIRKMKGNRTRSEKKRRILMYHYQKIIKFHEKVTYFQTNTSA